VLVVLIGYAFLFYCVAHTRAPRPGADGFPMIVEVRFVAHDARGGAVVID